MLPSRPDPTIVARGSCWKLCTSYSRGNRVATSQTYEAAKSVIKYRDDCCDYSLCASPASISFVTSGESGTVFESNRLRILPSFPIKNLLKFHLMSPGKGESFPARAE